MTDEYADEHDMSPEPEEVQPAGEDDAGEEVSPNPRDTGAYRIDQLLAQNLRGALDESKRRTGELDEVDAPEEEPAPEPEEPEVFSWSERTDTFRAVEQASTPGSEPEHDGPSLLEHEEEVRASQRMNTVSDGVLGKPTSTDEVESVWNKFKRWLMPTEEERLATVEERLAGLNDAIEDAPEAAVNYLARGELYLEIGQVDEAIADLEQAVTLATKEFEDRRWGVVAQAIRDRATRGLDQAQKRR